MATQATEPHRSFYELQLTHKSSTSLTQPFILTDASGEVSQKKFENFEQVMNFLLDELLGEIQNDEDNSPAV
jgi:hypothetical protein